MDNRKIGIFVAAILAISVLAAMPASNMTAALLDGNEIQLNWTGEDDFNGSGIRDYTIYVSEDEMLYMPWLAHTTNMSAVFVGESGHTYAFYSVAMDNAGNIEEAPEEPDAAVHVSDGITIIFEEDFESGWDGWGADSGVWQVGTPTAGPESCRGGSQCAGTNLTGNYPSDTDSRLISPSVMLPAVSGDEEIHLRFWHWFSYSDDEGHVQVSVYNGSDWGEWEPVGIPIQYSSEYWSLADRDITQYAGEKIRIAFYHTVDWSYESTGWYIDNVEIIKSIPTFTGDFESGWDGWGADSGVWQVGTPTAGPESCRGGSQCAGTNLTGNYPSDTDSRLISPSVMLPAVSGDEEIHLRFWHWFSYSDDEGHVQVSVYNGSDWGEWEPVGIPIQYSSEYWSLADRDITQYAGEKIRIAFYHTVDWSYESTGWYIDNVEITGINQLPVASFTYLPPDPLVNETITFDAYNSTDPDGTIVNYEWNFGDGNITNTSEEIITHSYSEAGDYTVNLTVTDDGGATNTSVARIKVSSMPDLMITEKWVNWPECHQPGINCTICYNLTNIGNGTTPACHNATLYVDGEEVAHDYIPENLAPNASYIGCFEDYNWTYTPPEDNITVCADNNNTVDESNETNNCLTNIWKCGDVNKDGRVTMSDVRKVYNRYLDPSYSLCNEWAGDVNCDGRITMSDVRKVYNRYLDPSYDLNCCCEQVIE